MLESFGVYAVDSPENDDKANEYAQFAAKAHNEDGGEDHVRFVRLVRAWSSIGWYDRYRMMLEAVDGKGELNLYYADVIERPTEKTELIKWELVDQSFSYPFKEYRWSEELKEEIRQMNKRDRKMGQEMEKNDSLRK